MWQSCTGSGAVEKARKIVLAFPVAYAKLLQGLPKRRYYRRGSSMGWGEVRASVSHFRHVPIVLLSAALLGGCFQPLYGTGSEPGRPAVRDALSAIDIAQIDAAANTSEAPLAVQIRNDLLFNFTGGGYPAPPTHKLKVQINGNRAVVSIDRATALPNIETYTLRTSYSLTEIAT